MVLPAGSTVRAALKKTRFTLSSMAIAAMSVRPTYLFNLANFCACESAAIVEKLNAAP